MKPKNKAMEPELKEIELETVTPEAITTEEVVIAQLDFTNPEHRAIFIDMIIAQTIIGVMNNIKNFPLAGEIIAEILLKPMFNSHQGRAWGKAGGIFPQTIGKEIKFNAKTGEFLMKVEI